MHEFPYRAGKSTPSLSMSRNLIVCETIVSTFHLGYDNVWHLILQILFDIEFKP